jgi:hypothetical protein
MPFVAYVHSRDPDPLPEQPEGRTPWEPNWRVWRWILAAAVVVFAATRTDGAVQLLLVMIAFGLGCQAAAAAVPLPWGMRDYRQ